jgi:hypothetical protein
MLVSITDLTGRVIRREEITTLRGFNSFTYDVDDLAAGAYYLKIENSENESVRLQAQFFKN